jgi:hypothetical protein
MKNLHLIPTDKASRLYKSKITQNISMGNVISQHGDATYNLNIYITSDEEIKEGDYVYSTSQDYNIQKVSKELVKAYQEIEHYKKIILTTDQDLIKDGVQAIDNEFLEWFVKNPTCRFVDVKKRYSEFTVDPFVGYRIIIPQEEPKQETLTYTEAAKKEERIFNSTMMSKQETLEEAANRLFYTVGNEGISSIDSFMKGANYQSERMYSEEDVIAFMQFIISNPDLSNTSSVSETTARYYLEQFKKK